MTEKVDPAEQKALRKALIEGEKSCVAGPLDIERIKREALEPPPRFKAIQWPPHDALASSLAAFQLSFATACAFS